MDEFMFRIFVGRCREVQEATSYLEVMNYSVSMPQREVGRGADDF
jgi:hypothetical protein